MNASTKTSMMTNPGAAEVRLEKITKRYGNVTAVKPLDLVIPPGSLVTLLGPSGCGKTTLLRMIAGLERSSGGKLCIGGKDVTDLSAGERNVSMVFQSYALFPHMNVLDNVAYGLVSSGMARRDAHGKAEETLATVGLRALVNACLRRCRAASSNGWPWPVRWFCSPMCCCSTSRCPISMHGCAARCARKFVPCSRR